MNESFGKAEDERTCFAYIKCRLTSVESVVFKIRRFLRFFSSFFFCAHLYHIQTTPQLTIRSSVSRVELSMESNDAASQLQKAISELQRCLATLNMQDSHIRSELRPVREEFLDEPKPGALHSEDPEANIVQCTPLEDSRRVRERELGRLGGLGGSPPALRNICEQLIAIFGVELVRRSLLSKSAVGQYSQGANDIPSQSHMNSDGDPSLDNEKNYGHRPAKTFVSRPLSAVSACTARSPVSDKARREKLRKSVNMMKRKTLSFGEKCSTACLFVYWDPASRQWRCVMCMPGDRLLPDFNEIVRYGSSIAQRSLY